MHLLMNMYVLVGWGPPLERALGTKRFILLYFLTGIAAGCTSVVGAILFPGTHSPNGSVGASGALFGIIGAVMALRRRQLGSFQAFFADKGVRSILVQIGVWTAIGVYALNLDNAAHLGGFVSGFAACWVMSSPPAARRNGWLALVAAVARSSSSRRVRGGRPPEGTPTISSPTRTRISSATSSTPDGARSWPHDVARGSDSSRRAARPASPRRARRSRSTSSAWARPTPPRSRRRSGAVRVSSTPASTSSSTDGLAAGAVERFLREGYVANRIEHPGRRRDSRRRHRGGRHAVSRDGAARRRVASRAPRAGRASARASLRDHRGAARRARRRAREGHRPPRPQARQPVPDGGAARSRSSTSASLA